MRHPWRRTKRSWPLFSPTFFFLSFFFFLFSYAFCFSPTSGNLPCVKICFPQYFGITRRYMQKIFCLGNFYSFTSVFSYFLRPAFSHGRLGQPQSHEFCILFSFCVFIVPEIRGFFLLFKASVQSRPPGPPAVLGVFLLLFR